MVTAVAELLEHERQRVEHERIAVGDEEEEPGEVPGHRARGEAEDQAHKAERLDHRGEQLDQHVVGEDDEAEAAVARVEEKAAVAPQDIGEPALPAVALPAQDPHRGGNLGPGHRVGHEDDAVRPPPLQALAAQPHDQLHVLADGPLEVPAGVEH